MPNELFKDAEERMLKAEENLRREYASLRAGRATPALLDRIMVDYYGTPTPINHLANISVPDPRMLVIQPWDKNVLSHIEKAILKSNLGLTPTNDGSVIRLNIPQLTEERRKELVKAVKKMAEEAKVAIRNIRRDANERLKNMEKNGEISEDDSKRHQDEIQKLTDKYIKEVEKIQIAKEKEIMEV
ncbi:MAG TPA: ribosome recycling factor [Clostridia bacterium]|nr:ribosome recycling factor [Clostridia bacterium]